MNKALLGVGDYGYITIQQYINFYKSIPSHLWSNKPIFYYRKKKYDALGFLGESPHRYTLQSKVLSLYFLELTGHSVTDVWEMNEIKDNPKDKFISILNNLAESNSSSKFIRVFNRANNMYNDRYY